MTEPTAKRVLHDLGLLRNEIQSFARLTQKAIVNRPNGASKAYLRERMARLEGMCAAYNFVHGQGRPLYDHDRELYQLVADTTEIADKRL